ncbi:MAG: hypothetical protein Kow0010_25290 [Dehalococcoidia bacterium]
MRRHRHARVALVGLPFFAERAARFLRAAGFAAEYVASPTFGPGALAGALAITRADLVYAIGSSVRVRSPLDLAARAGKRVVMHWVGTDVQAAAEAWHRRCVSERLLTGATHLVDAPWLAGELRLLGIHAEERPLPVPIAIGEPVPLPETFCVLVYLPTQPHAAYDIAGTIEVIRALPHVRFVVVGGFRGELPANAHALGFVDDIEPVYRDVSAVLRLTRHDGLSHTIVEALSFGRYAVWSRPFPGVREASGVEEALVHLRELADCGAKGELPPNEPGIAAAGRYQPERVLIETQDWLRQVLSR